MAVGLRITVGLAIWMPFLLLGASGTAQDLSFLPNQYSAPLPDEYQALTMRLDQLEGELAAMRAQLAQPPAVHGIEQLDAPRTCGLTGGAMLCLLRPYHTSGIRGADETDFRFDFEAALRANIGFTAPSGWGLRVTYFDFDESVAGPSITAGRTDSVAFDLYTLDGELTFASEFCCWDTMLGAGVRYYDYDELRISTTNATGAIFRLHRFASTGLGPTASLYARRDLLGDFGLFTNLRGSVLVGDEQERVRTGVEDDETDNIRSIWEMQLGIQWSRPLPSGGTLFLQAASEAQYWNNFSGEEFYDGGESTGFLGASFAIGLMR